MEIIEDNDFRFPGANITLLPAENSCGKVTDENSGDEDNLQPSNLSASPLRAPAGITFSEEKNENRIRRYYSSCSVIFHHSE